MAGSPREIVGRIIPARAGFTHGAHPAGHGDGDHPRSRGVYYVQDYMREKGVGSSPLARGLPMWLATIDTGRGIIPARAGFTRRVASPARASRDHPRSRGVYPGEPAAWSLGGDHPRSRGVYTSSALTGARACGSSPLARGLPEAHLCGSLAVGIIPARAGFTPHRPGGGAPAQDHPRSRGVYIRICDALGIRPGSSPLARGLHGGLSFSPVRGWIIPARAGFTTRTTSPASSARDHPRSRGVYLLRPSSRQGHNGSSPLARGLQALYQAVL